MTQRISLFLLIQKNKYPILILLGVIADQFTKIWAEATLSMYRGVVIIPKLMEFQLVHNYGAAYGILQNQRVFLLSVSVVVLIVCIVFRKYIATTPLSKYGLSFLLIGTIGNFIDRVRLSYVIDFINIHIFPVFNIADMAIDLGLVLFAIELFVYRNTVPSSKDQEGELDTETIHSEENNEKNTTSN